MTSKLTSETLDDETLAELIAFRRSRVEYCQKEGLPYQKALHDSMMLALEELQERRKADSEPVAEVVSIYGDPEAFGEREIRPLVGIQQMPYGTKLYRHAQQPVVPEEMTIRDACKFVQDIRLFDDVSVIVMRTWNACRAAMLERQLVDRVDEKSLTSINPAPDLVSLQKKAESIIGNSPGIPDGYVMVPKEPTKQMILAGQEELESCIDNGFDSDIDGNRYDYTDIVPDAPHRVFMAMLAAALQEGK